MNRGLLWGIVAIVLAVGAIVWLTRPPEQLPPEPPPAPAAEGPSPAVLAKLARGVNLSNWLQQGMPTEAQRYAPDEEDWVRIRALGFSHVRILLDPAYLVDDRGLPRPEALGELRGAIDSAGRADLLVVIALQLPSALKLRLPGNESDRIALGGLWRALAAALRGLAPERLVLEPLNEPEVDDVAASRSLLSFLAAEIRAVLPKHTLVASGARFASIEDLGRLRPLDDPNLVYGFHFYEPHNFTHQGATWGDPKWRDLKNFPYPSSPERVAPLLPSVPAKQRDLLKWHGDQRWDRNKVARQIGLAAQWQQLYKRPVWCSEFGVLKKRAAPADRRAWLRDVREALDRKKIPWTHWDYAGPFGVVSGNRGARVVDEGVVEALGLKKSSSP